MIVKEAFGDHTYTTKLTIIKNYHLTRLKKLLNLRFKDGGRPLLCCYFERNRNKNGSSGNSDATQNTRPKLDSLKLVSKKIRLHIST